MSNSWKLDALIFCISANGYDATFLDCLTSLYVINIVKYHTTSVTNQVQARGPVLISPLLKSCKCKVEEQDHIELYGYFKMCQMLGLNGVH